MDSEHNFAVGENRHLHGLLEEASLALSQADLQNRSPRAKNTYPSERLVHHWSQFDLLSPHKLNF